MKFVVECKPDVVFAEVLEAEEIDHSFGKSRVIKKVAKSNTVTVGVVDEDPGKPAPKRLEEFVEIGRFEEHGFVVLGYGSVGFLLMLKPRLEEWVLEACREAGVDPKSFGLPDEGDELHRVINISTKRFRELLEFLRNRSARIEKLVGVIRRLAVN